MQIFYIFVMIETVVYTTSMFVSIVRGHAISGGKMWLFGFCVTGGLFVNNLLMVKFW